MITTSCRECGNEFLTYPSKVKAERGKYCSKVCYWESLKTHPSHMLGKKHSPEAIEKMRRAQMGKSKGKRNPLYKGRYRDKKGYCYVHLEELTAKERMVARQMISKGKQHILIHRLKMAMKLKRPLLRDEVVHHLNGIKDDNRIGNLELHNPAEHSKTYHQIYKEMRSLRAENDRLKSLLATYQAAG